MVRGDAVWSSDGPEADDDDVALWSEEPEHDEAEGDADDEQV